MKIETFLRMHKFKQDEEDNLRWNVIGSYDWEYRLYYEGYAYVLYMVYKGREVPLSHFRNIKSLHTFYRLLNVKFKDKFYEN